MVPRSRLVPHSPCSMARPAHHLATLVEQVTSSALSSGALSPNRTRGHVLADSGVVWSIRILETLKKKAAAAAGPGTQRPNPFLPHEPDLFVCDLSQTHKLLLNKFPVNRGHVLICTRDFVEQREPLQAPDFEATALCVHALDGIAFYNFGVHSGRSQPHKHLQVVPLPLDSEVEAESHSRWPTLPLFEASFRAAGGDAAGTEEAVLLRGLPFTAAASSVPASALPQSGEDVATTDLTWASRAGAALERAYHNALHALGVPLARADEEGRVSYNVLFCRRLLVVVPRGAEESGPLGVNALAFAGSFFVKSEAALQYVKEYGPMRILGDLGVASGGEGASGGAGAGGDSGRR